MLMTLLTIREKWKWFSTCQAKESEIESEFFCQNGFWSYTILDWTQDDADDDDDQ